MKRFYFIPLTGLSALLFAVGIVGCSQSSDSGTAAGNNPKSPGDEHTDHDHGSMAGMEKGLSELSEADRATAMKQHMCPVSGEMLGTMGKPLKLTVKDHDVWICCNGCKKQILDDPDKYLAKLLSPANAGDNSDHKDHANHKDGT